MWGVAGHGGSSGDVESSWEWGSSQAVGWRSTDELGLDEFPATGQHGSRQYLGLGTF